MVKHRKFTAQAECLKAIQIYMRESKYSPTFDEIATMITPNSAGIPSSRSSVMRWVTGLIRAELVVHAPLTKRGIALTVRGWLVSNWEIERIEEYLNAGDYSLPEIGDEIAAIIGVNAERKVLEIFHLITTTPPAVIIDPECLPAFNYGFQIFREAVYQILGHTENSKPL